MQQLLGVLYLLTQTCETQAIVWALLPSYISEIVTHYFMCLQLATSLSAQ